MAALRTAGGLPRRALEAAFFVAVVALFWGLDTLTKLDEFERRGVTPDHFRLYVEQATSALAVLLLVPLVARWLRYFPIGRERPASVLAGHVVGSMLFAALHYWLMVFARYAIYTLTGRYFVFSERWWDNLVYEYRKDIKIYVAIVGIITVYRYWRASKEQSRAAVPPADRLVVQTGSGERILKLDDIDHCEAARNYVVVHAAGREHLLRETLTRLAERLPEGRFARTHRSFIVNIDRIREIRTTDAGGYRIEMESGATVPLSRSYREPFRAMLSQLPNGST